MDPAAEIAKWKHFAREHEKAAKANKLKIASINDYTAEKVVDGIDLNSIVREASASVSTEMIGDMRSGSERADDRVDEFVGRILRRKGGS